MPKAAGAAGLMPAAGAHASGSRKRYAAVHHNGAHLNDWLTAPVRIEIP